ncbi:MAG: acyl-CoA thioesterase [Flavobacteriales bacterium]|nr:acyl-CoA thioesterase [Flavobacteriales bacterium]
METRLRTSVEIRFSDIDIAGHVHNSKYLDYFENGRMAYLAQFVPADHDWLKESMLVVRNELEYHRSVRLNERIFVDTWCSRLGNTSFDLRYRVIMLEGDKELLCTSGRSTMVCVRLDTRKTIPIPSAWRRSMVVLEEA